jgi:hypothetical protein
LYLGWPVIAEILIESRERYPGTAELNIRNYNPMGVWRSAKSSAGAPSPMQPHEISRLARATSSKKVRIFPGSFLPGRASTPLATSTA